jgi:hypothetical protein
VSRLRVRSGRTSVYHIRRKRYIITMRRKKQCTLAPRSAHGREVRGEAEECVAFIFQIRSLDALSGYS